MSRRPDTTVILITDSVVYRADFRNASREAFKFSTSEKVIDVSIGDAIRQVENPALEFGRKVVLLSTSVWTQMINVPRLSIVDLGQTELSSVLKFEAETLIGIDADQMVIGWARGTTNEDNQQFWINAIALPEWSGIVDYLVTEKKSKSVWLAHPLGVADIQFFDKRPHLECWGNNISRIASLGDVEALSESGNQSHRWPGELGFVSSQDAAQSVVLLGPEQQKAESPVFDPDRTIDLSDPELLKNWMKAILARLADRSSRSIPWVQRAKSAPRASFPLVARVGIIVLVCALCAWHFVWIKSRQQKVHEQIALLRQPAIEKKKSDSMLQAVLDKRTQTKLEATESKLNLEKIRYLFTRQVDRIPRLLQLLNEIRTQELVVKQIESHKTGLVVSGVSLNGESAPLMANRLRDVASEMGWKTQPATQNGEMKLTSGGPWRFAILLEDVGPFANRNEGQSVVVFLPPYLRTSVFDFQKTNSELTR